MVWILAAVVLVLFGIVAWVVWCFWRVGRNLSAFHTIPIGTGRRRRRGE